MPDIPPMTLNVERLYQDLTLLRRSLEDEDSLASKDTILLIDVLLASIDHTYADAS